MSAWFWSLYEQAALKASIKTKKHSLHYEVSPTPVMMHFIFEKLYSELFSDGHYVLRMGQRMPSKCNPRIETPFSFPKMHLRNFFVLKSRAMRPIYDLLFHFSCHIWNRLCSCWIVITSATRKSCLKATQALG